MPASQLGDRGLGLGGAESTYSLLQGPESQAAFLTSLEFCLVL